MARHQMYDHNQQLISLVEHCEMIKAPQLKALDYLEKRGFKLSQRTYARLLARVRADTEGRLSYIAYKEFASQHIRSIDTINNTITSMYTIATDENAQLHARIRAADVVNNLIKTKTELYDGNPIVAAIADELNKSRVKAAAGQ